MDDFSKIITSLEAAKQLAEMNDLDLLVYLISVAQSETRENRTKLRGQLRGAPRVARQAKASEA